MTWMADDIRIRENTFLTSGLRLHSLWMVSEIQLRTVMTQMGARGPRRSGRLTRMWVYQGCSP